MGGVLTLYVCRVDDILSIPDPFNKTIDGDIVFKAGSGFVRWDVTTETPRTKSTSRSSREGAAKSNLLSFLAPRDRQELSSMFDIAEDDALIVAYRDSNNNLKLFGTKDRPLIFRYDHDSGQRHADGNFYSCSFSFDGPDNIYFYTGTITEQPEDGSVAVVQYVTGDVIATLAPGDQLIVTSDFEHTFTLVPGSSPSAEPAIVKWDDDTLIASMQPGDVLLVDTDFSFDFELIGNV